MTLNPGLLEDVIHPAALESCAQIVEDTNECKDQLRKQLTRLRELRVKKFEEPGTWFCFIDCLLGLITLTRCILWDGGRHVAQRGRDDRYVYACY